MEKRPTIVFLHGTRLTRAQWGPQVAALGDEFDCLALDLPGHGTRATEPFSLAGAADSVANAIAAEGGGRAIVVGLSLGGYVAMDLAARWPERVSGLVLAGATAEPRYFRRRYGPSIAEPIIAGGFGFRTGAQAVRAIIGEQFRPRLASYPGRTLILNGEFDLLFRLSERSFAAVAADPRRVLIRRATHLANLDQPEAFSAAIRRFARGL